MMSALVEERIDTPVPIIDGYVTIYLPHFSLKIVQKVRQVKGRGTYDAIKLRGQKPHSLHLKIIKVMKNSEPLTAEQIHFKVVRSIYFETDKTPKIKQSYFQRFHSELLWLKIIKQIGVILNVPLYQLDKKKAEALENGGVFS